jgi:uncharacterized protein
MSDEHSPKNAPRSAEGEHPRSPDQELRHALIVFFGATALCALLFQLRRFIPFLNDNLHAFIAAIFLYLPTTLINRRRENFDDYGLSVRPVAKGLLYFAVVSSLVLPLFGLGAFYYYRVVCALSTRYSWLPRLYRRICFRLVKGWSSIRWKLQAGFLQNVAAQVVVVGLPEEYFFRGYLQTTLNRKWPAKRRFLGAPVSLSVVVTSILFALGHVLVDFNGLRFAVFFPSLLFGWMRQATGSILAGVLFHAASNIVSGALHTWLFSG